MNFFRFWASGLVLIGLGAGAGQASALDAQRPLHHSRLTEPHLTETHRSAHHSSARAARRSTTAHARATHTSGSHAATAGHSATSRRVSYTHRHHRYYERFTASSFAKGDIFAGDITAGEDPVVRQAAIDALGEMNGTA